MGYYKLIRQAKEGKSVPGHLCRVEHRWSGSGECYVEHLTPLMPTLENADHLVPALIYKVAVTRSPRFKRLLPVLQQVPGRTGIRFHRGCLPEHSKGCILVSPQNEKVLTALWLKEQNEHEEIRIEFSEAQ